MPRQTLNSFLRYYANYGYYVSLKNRVVFTESTETLSDKRSSVGFIKVGHLSVTKAEFAAAQKRFKRMWNAWKKGKYPVR
jgi:hypothetical protein